MRNFVLALCLLLFILTGWFMYKYAADCCQGAGSDQLSSVSDQEQVEEPLTDPAEDRMSDYLMFRWSEDEPVLREDWDTRKNRIINRLEEGELLEITGLYRAEETNNTTFENLGIARANEVRALLVPPLDSQRVTLNARLVADGITESGLSTAVNFRNYVKKANLDTSIPDRTIIRFPFNSDNKLDDSEVEAYLDKVATRVIASGERVRLTGHTDNIGSTESNLTLGQKRADIIKRYLINRGVPAAKIITESKGEASPIASNSTSAGRAENRRSELQIIN